MTDNQHTDTAAAMIVVHEISRWTARGWQVTSHDGAIATIAKPGRRTVPFRLATFRGLALCVLTGGILFIVWLLTACCYSWWAKTLPIHRTRSKIIEARQVTDPVTGKELDGVWHAVVHDN